LTVVLVGGLATSGFEGAAAMPAPVEADRAPLVLSYQGLRPLRLAQTQPQTQPAPLPRPPAPPAAGPATSAAPASTTTPAASEEPIGNVATLTGVATVIRNNNSTPLTLKDDIYLNDTVETAVNSSLGVTFNDATTFNLRASSRITIDNYVYEDGGKANAGIFDIAKGTVAFVAAAVAKTGNMSITTPTATLGIRGTTGLVEVPRAATAGGANDVNIKLYPDPDGRVGRIEVNDRAGARLGALTQGASGFAIRPGSGGARLAAVPLAISAQQAQRDQGFVRQVHATQSVGRQIVSEQRAFRRANPGLNNRVNPLQRPNNAPGQNRPGSQPTPPQAPAAPNRQGAQPQRPGGGQGTAAPSRPNGQPSPAQPTPPNARPQPSNGPAQRQGLPPLPQGGPPKPGEKTQERSGEKSGETSGEKPGPSIGAPARRPPQTGFQPRQPGAQRPLLQSRPALRRPPPKGKKDKP
jgi:hypothetical protein